jgi:hypothetical protein
MSATMGGNVVGLEPWLPWPLRTWGWWTQPIRAERVAALRIGLAACLLIDIWTSYRPQLLDFFGQGGLGGSQMFAYYGFAPKLNWSLLRGFGDPLLGSVALVTWTVLSAWFVFDFGARLTARDAREIPPSNGWSVFWWMACGLFVVLGVWSRSIKDAGESQAAWTVPLGMLAVAVLFLLLEFWRCRRGECRDNRLRLFIPNVLVLLAAVGLGLVLPFEEWSREKTFSLAHRLLLSWQDDAGLLAVAFWTWVAATVLLLAGCWTWMAAPLTWALSISFASVNPHIDNAGDTIRGIGLFFLMLSPCAAAWSVDRFIQRRRRGADAPAMVWPWAMRLLFIQLAVIYFMNGLYKVTGANWLEGDSLYYVMCDLTLTRFSIAQMPMPFVAVQILTWLVLAWELAFPLLVLFRWTRTPALLCGVAFHLGIFSTLELGGFGPYVLCLYLPLLPWKLVSRSQSDKCGTHIDLPNDRSSAPVISVQPPLQKQDR